MGFFIPETLKSIDNAWLCRKGKVPYYPLTGRKANPTKGYCDYATAVNHLEYEDYDGIGFAMVEGSNLVCIDLDNCVNEEGDFSAIANELISMFSDCFIEYSQSENGIHIFAKGTLPNAINNKEYGIEIYPNKHYIAITGNVYNDSEPSEAQTRLNMLFSMCSKKEAIKQENNQFEHMSVHIFQDADKVIETIKKSKQKEKFLRLHSGKLEGYPSTSEAAFAYLNIVYFFSSGNYETIKAIFENSYFGKTKHCKKEYMERAIKKIQKDTKVYTKANGAGVYNIGKKKKTISNQRSKILL